MVYAPIALVIYHFLLWVRTVFALGVYVIRCGLIGILHLGRLSNLRITFTLRVVDCVPRRFTL